jgi:lauroyl/myristoyl acyltransferase
VKELLQLDRSGIGDLVQRAVVKCLRLAESCLPIPALVLVLLPAAAAIATCELLVGGRHATFRQLRQMSEAARRAGLQWGHCSLWKVWSRRVAMCLARFLRFWPDKLREARWSRRCQIVGLERLETAITRGRPVVLTTLHYGNLTDLILWIRSRGIGIAFLSNRKEEDEPAYQRDLNFQANRVNGLDGVPAILGIDYLNLWRAVDFLASPNRVLVVAVEGYSKRDIWTHGHGCDLRIAPGALRLAEKSGAAVIPCLISVGSNMRASIYFDEPLPEDWVADRARYPAACDRIASTLYPWVASQPEQSAPLLIRAVRFGNDQGS